MSYSKKIFLLVLIPLLCFSCSKNQNTKTVTEATYNRELVVGAKKIFVSVADTDEKRQEGLSGQKKLNDEQGMIFIFNTESHPAFWMIDMKFDLDLIWIDKNKITGITPNVPKPDACNEDRKTCLRKLPLYYPPSVVDEVLEVNSGWAEKNNVKVGDEIILKN